MQEVYLEIFVLVCTQKFVLILKVATLTLRFVAYDSYSGVCDLMQTHKVVVF